MASLFESARARAKEAVSSVLCSASGLQRAVNDFNGKVNPFYTGSRGEAVTRRIERELGRFCPIPPAPAPTTGPPPFAGGQCATAYTIDYSIRAQNEFNCSESIRSNSTNPIMGPIGGWRLGGTPVEYSCGGPKTGYREFQVAGADGVFGNAASSPGSLLWVEILSASVRRLDGLPDDCGDPPGPPIPPPPPSNPRPTLPDVDVDFPGLPPISIPLTAVVGIVNVNVDGRITVPVTVNASFDLGGQSFDIDFNFDVDLGNPDAEPTVPPVEPPLDPDDRPAPPDCPPPSGCAPGDEEDEEPDEPPIDPDDPEDEKEQEIKSVRVMSIVNPERSPATEILMTGGAPNIFAPRIGSVKFVYAVVPGVVAWSTDIDVKASNQVIPAPKTGLRCLGAVFSPGAGVEGETFFTRGRRCDCD